jgi:cytolysin (calcineurin-like family phosphatase)
LKTTAAGVFLFLLSFLQPPVLSDTSTAGRNLTFFLLGDTHYGLNKNTADYNRAIIDEINALPGTPYPEAVLTGTVEIPRGVVVVGDLVEHGHKKIGLKEWEEYTCDFGVVGEGRIAFPVYEGFGNHDGGLEHGIRQLIKDRNAQRAGLAHLSKNGYHYSWNWEGIHFIQLNLFPGTVADKIPNPLNLPLEGSWREPLHSLKFLKADLKKHLHTKTQPVIIFMHFGVDPWGFYWWSNRERKVFYKAIKEYPVQAIFFGHTHVVQSFTWKGIPTFCVGSSQKKKRPGEFMVVNIKNNKMYVLVRKLHYWSAVYKVKFKN